MFDSLRVSPEAVPAVFSGVGCGLPGAGVLLPPESWFPPEELPLLEEPFPDGLPFPEEPLFPDELPLPEEPLPPDVLPFPEEPLSPEVFPSSGVLLSPPEGFLFSEGSVPSV